MSVEAALQGIKAFDAYPKFTETAAGDFRVKTISGAIFSFLCILLTVFLFLAELSRYTALSLQPEITIDTIRGEQLTINFDIVFPHLSCNLLGVDSMDVTGVQQIDITDTVYKKRLDAKGNVIGEEMLVTPPYLQPVLKTGSCYGAAPDDKQCSCSEVQQLYRQKGWSFTNHQFAQCEGEESGLGKKAKEEPNEGCNLYGSIVVNKVAGNFHIAPALSFKENLVHLHGSTADLGDVNCTHIIRKLSFGEYYIGLVNPLDNTINVDESANAMIQYFAKVVPTEFTNSAGQTLVTNQYSVTAHTTYVTDPEGGMPGVYFMYDLSPIRIRFMERKVPLSHFVTSVCAIIGGVFTVTGLLDSLVYRGMKHLRTKKTVH